ncbi:MAG: ABC transporter substrate-binding protein [Lachnospiraceae bacterium]|nr:ABC transporter substrate-binding protein [Lachnospiraceae bacterium]
MNGRKKAVTICSLLLTGLLGQCSCGSPASALDPGPEAVAGNENMKTAFRYESSMELAYAENFSVDYYEGGYTLLTIMDESRFLVVPEGKEAPVGLEEDIVILQRPIKDLYLVATAAMNMFSELDALDAISLSGQEADGWYLEEARTAMEKGEMVYAGKYNKPDYELILSKDCSLAIENRMISHSPEVAEKLEGFGIPVMIDYSSYESHPLGRVEWIKFYGALLGKEEQAEEIFEEQAVILERVSAEEKTDKTVAFFFITAGGMVQVRTTSDYVPKMIELAGGRYVFDELGEQGTRQSTMNIQMEEFYRTAKDADFLIYNSAIDGGVASLDELLEKSELLGDFKAVQEGNVFCTTNDLYQQSMSIGFLIEDMHNMLSEEEEEQKEMKYLFRLE